MNIDYEAVRFWLNLLQLVVTAGVWLYVWISNRNRVNNERLTTLEKSLDKRLDNHASRLAAVESECQHAPRHEHLAGIHEKINQVGSGVSQLQGEMKSIAGSLRLVQEHLLKITG